MLRDFLISEGYILDESKKDEVRAFIKTLASRWHLGMPYYCEASHDNGEVDRFSYYNEDKKVRDATRSHILDYIKRCKDKLPLIKVVKIVDSK